MLSIKLHNDKKKQRTKLTGIKLKTKIYNEE